MLHITPAFSIYFGDARDGLYPADYRALAPDTSLLSVPSFKRACSELSLQSLYFLQQTHSILGYHVPTPTIQPAFATEGDFLITNTPAVGIGVMTADCLPIVIYDPTQHACATIHAGWKGTTNGIITKALQELNCINPASLHLFFGPHAKSCCYEVSTEFVVNLPHTQAAQQSTENRYGLWYFSNEIYNRVLLAEYGVNPQQIHTDYALCTMCDHQYFSHRRQGTSAGRQMTVVALKAL